MGLIGVGDEENNRWILRTVRVLSGPGLRLIIYTQGVGRNTPILTIGALDILRSELKNSMCRFR